MDKGTLALNILEDIGIGVLVLGLVVIIAFGLLAFFAASMSDAE